jgi:ectoine hydroxylase-related dioxygenase (phytanoyl-CoA dioxygenase family)
MMMMEAFQIIPAVLTRAELEPLVKLLVKGHEDGRAHPGQTGFALTACPETQPLLALNELCSKHLNHTVTLRFDRSSCRLQIASGQGQLRLHQDKVALAGKKPGEIIAWVPLCDIDEETPTLEICPIAQGQFLDHGLDAVGYSVLRTDPGFPLITITRMTMGDVVLMMPTTLHRTSVKPWHTKSRLSLDLRFFP